MLSLSFAGASVLGLEAGCNYTQKTTDINAEGRKLLDLTNKISEIYEIEEGQYFQITVTGEREKPNIIIYREEENEVEIIRYIDKDGDGSYETRDTITAPCKMKLNVIPKHRGMPERYIPAPKPKTIPS